MPIFSPLASLVWEENEVTDGCTWDIKHSLTDTYTKFLNSFLASLGMDNSLILLICLNFFKVIKGSSNKRDRTFLFQIKCNQVLFFDLLPQYFNHNVLLLPHSHFILRKALAPFDIKIAFQWKLFQIRANTVYF